MASISSAGSFEWERPWEAGSFEARGSEDIGTVPTWDAADAEPSFAIDPGPEEAGEELAGYLLELHYKGTLSAKQTCCLAYWAFHAGASGPVKDLKVKPSAGSGKFSDHLKRVTGVKEHDERVYTFTAPAYQKACASRTTLRFETCPLHESLAEEVAHTPTIAEEVRRKVEAHDWPPLYTHHPVVTSAPQGVPVVPYILYLDGAPYSTSDSLLGVFAYTVVTEVRHLVAAIRKRDLCKCGCR